MTGATRDQLVELAVELALVAPLRRNGMSRSALVPWSTIEAIRDVLDDAGIDWHTLAAQVRE